jgi:hypothetical protein
MDSAPACDSTAAVLPFNGRCTDDTMVDFMRRVLCDTEIDAPWTLDMVAVRMKKMERVLRERVTSLLADRPDAAAVAEDVVQDVFHRAYQRELPDVPDLPPRPVPARFVAVPDRFTPSPDAEEDKVLIVVGAKAQDALQYCYVRSEACTLCVQQLLRRVCKEWDADVWSTVVTHLQLSDHREYSDATFVAPGTRVYRVVMPDADFCARYDMHLADLPYSKYVRPADRVPASERFYADDEEPPALEMDDAEFCERMAQLSPVDRENTEESDAEERERREAAETQVRTDAPWWRRLRA